MIHSRWRVKAAISLVLCSLTFCATAQSVTRDPYQKKITIAGQRVSLEMVLQQLSEQTRLYFIYSSNALELKKSFNFEMKERPLFEVLQKLSDIAGVKFRREGNYVVVKAFNELPAAQRNERPLAIKKNEVIAKAAQVPAYDASSRPMTASFDFSLDISNEFLKKTLLYCPPQRATIDTSGLKKYFPLSITNPQAKRHFFTSFNLLVNEYWAGAEIRAGLPSLYAVVNSGRLREGYFRHGIGIGTSLKLKPRISISPIYTFATVRRKEDYVIDEFRNIIIQDGLKIAGKHHQFKFLLQIQFTDRIRMQVGPTFNMLKTSYTYQKGIVQVSEVVTTSVQTDYGKYAQVGLVRSLYYLPPADYSIFKSWVGFEAGVSYGLKFSRR